MKRKAREDTCKWNGWTWPRLRVGPITYVGTTCERVLVLSENEW